MLQVYFIYSGTYTDTAIITRANVRVYGQTNSPSSYTGNSMHTFFFLPSCSPVSRPARPSIERLTTAVSTPATPAVTITNDIPASQAGSNDASGTVQVHASGVSLYNLNIENTYGKVRT